MGNSYRQHSINDTFFGLLFVTVLVCTTVSCTKDSFKSEISGTFSSENQSSLSDTTTTMVQNPPTTTIPASNSLFPTDRVTRWQGNVGVKGGIPTRTIIRDCVATDGVPTDGTTDSSVKIQNCLNNTPQGQVAYLRAGSFVLKSGGLHIPGNKTLRGAGPTQTLLTSETPLDAIVTMGAGSSSSTLLPIQSGYNKDNTTFTMSSTAGLAQGDFLLLNELNDTNIPVTATSDAPGEGPCLWCDQFGATRLRAQVVEIEGVNGNTVDIGPNKLFYNFSPGNQPRAMKLSNMTQYSGIENLTVKNGVGSTSGWRVNILIEGAANSWVKNVNVDTCGKRCIDLRHYFYRVEIRDSLITHCVDHSNSDACYGTEVAEGSNSLVENNIYYDTSNGPILMWGASGNVISYNYIHSVFRFQQRDSWFWPNSWSHGAHTSYNLWEGNDFAGLNWDGYWGSSSHNMAFRNRIWGSSPLQGLVPGHVEVGAILIEANNNYMSAVGNVLGTNGWSDTYEEKNNLYWGTNPIYSIGIRGDTKAFSTFFRHMNYDYKTKTTRTCNQANEPGCQGSDGSSALPASLYLTTTPSWFGSVPWPPVNPVGPVVNDLPAKIRFNGL